MKKGTLGLLGLAAVLTLGLASVNENREVKEVNAASETAILSFADIANRTSYSTTQQVWEQNGITLTNNKATSTTNVADYSNPARFYKNSELIVEANGNISKIVFTCSGGNSYYLSDVTNGVSDGAVTTVTLDGTSNSYTIPSLANQVRLASVEVTYSPDPSLELKELISGYYHEGVYAKQTDIYLKENVETDLKTYFHGGSIPTLSRTTYYIGDALWMENGSADSNKKYSYYGTSGNDMTSGRVAEVGDVVDNIAVKGQTMEQYYATLYDFIEGTHNSVHSNNQDLDLTAGWSKDENNVFTSSDADVLDGFRLFTAPLWIGKNSNNENYLSFTNATVEVNDQGNLVMKLYVSTTEYSAAEGEGKITDKTGLFSQAIISYEHTGGTATCLTKGVCEYCGVSYGEFAEHTYGTTYVPKGDEGHAYQCTTEGCDAFQESSVMPHEYVDGICECGKEQVQAGQSVTASKTIADLITEYKWTSSTTKQTFNLDDNVTVKVNGGSNSGKAYDSNHIRLYATDNPAGSLTITLAEGYELVSVKVSCETGTYAFLYVGDGTTDISNVATEVSGSSVILNSVKNGSDGKQVRVTAIEVVYKSA